MEYLNQNGYKCELSYIISEADDKIFYAKGFFFLKMLVVIKAYFKRYRDIFRSKEYDVLFIFREAFMTGTTFFEKKFSKSNAQLVFDFDDAIWLHDTSEGNKKFEWLKNPDKTAKLISLSDMVFAGNHYLADYAKQYNKNVAVIPTTINVNYHKRSESNSDKEKICIGWTGSHTTIKHFKLAENAMVKLKEKYEEKIYFKVIGDAVYINEKLAIKGIAWSLENEIKELEEIDIGIMPLPDDDWSKGKCGFKGLQYMAMEIPAVMSPVGVNTEIISDGVNGFLANGDDEWIEKLSRLIEDKNLRQKMGKEARKTVVENYSFDSQKGNYLKYFNELLGF